MQPNIQRRQLTAHTSSLNADAARKRDLGHIHQGKKSLSWSDEDYRFHLLNLTGKSSSGELDAAGREKVLSHMAKLGFKSKTRSFKPFDQAAKISWLWKKIGLAGGLRDCSQGALMTFVARTCGATYSDLKFIPTEQASKTIEALKAMLIRAESSQEPSHG